ncbi:MAG: polyisoprenoid-binding protein [Cytophagales bacterium]|nr:polyisoprenoid-binding protein [Cytophaga sp.]
MATTIWNLDPTHSEVGFKVKHMMITNVSGSFGTFGVQVSSDGADFTKSSIEFTADVTSVSTGNEQRDGHLKSGDFFDAEKFPKISFSSTSFEKKSDDEYVLKGNLTIKDITKSVQLSVEYGGIGKDPWGNEKAGFTITGKINRTDFGLNWNAALETGGVLVSEEIKLSAEIQLVKKV